MLVPTGRGSDLLDKELPPEEYEKVLTLGLHAPEDEPAALQADRRAALLPHHPAAGQGRGQEGHARGVRSRRDDARLPGRHHLLLHQPHRRHPAVRLLRHAARQRQGAAVLARSGPSPRSSTTCATTRCSRASAARASTRPSAADAVRARSRSPATTWSPSRTACTSRRLEGRVRGRDGRRLIRKRAPGRRAGRARFSRGYA